MRGHRKCADILEPSEGVNVMHLFKPKSTWDGAKAKSIISATLLACSYPGTSVWVNQRTANETMSEAPDAQLRVSFRSEYGHLVWHLVISAAKASSTS